MKVTFTGVSFFFLETTTTWASEVTPEGQENKHQTWSNYYAIKFWSGIQIHGEFLRFGRSNWNISERWEQRIFPVTKEPQLPSTCHPLQPAVASPWWVQSSPWRSTARLQTWAGSIRFLIIEWSSTTGIAHFQVELCIILDRLCIPFTSTVFQWNLPNKFSWNHSSTNLFSSEIHIFHHFSW